MTNDDQRYQPWAEGQSTKPEVDALMAAWPPDSIRPGEWIVSDEQVKEIVRPHTVGRYRVVYTRWINRLSRDHQVMIYRDRERGFYCPTAEQIFSRTHPSLARAGRTLKKQLRGINNAKPTNAIESATQEHQGRLIHAVGRDLKKARMNTLPSSVVPAAPQIGPPKKKGELS